MIHTMIRKHWALFVAGAVGGAVSITLVALAVLAVVTVPGVWNAGRDRFEDAVRGVVTAERLLDSAGNNSDVVNVVNATSDAVVSIVITKDVPKLETMIDQGRSPFGLFGLGLPQYRQNGTETIEVGGGSGFLVSEDGYVVTNAHVVEDREANYSVLMNNGETYEATIVATDETLDVAVLKIDGNDLPFLTFGDSDAVQVGQTVVAIGNALGEFRNTVSVGVISGLSRSIVAGGGMQSEILPDVMQTDAAINPGNSGGPLLDLAGNVIGVNVATSTGGENISFALPGNAVRQTVDSIREHGRVIRAYLGVHFVTITPAFAKKNSLSQEQGALIRRPPQTDIVAVVPGSPADKAGIEENDIVLQIDDIVLDERHPLDVVLRGYAVGDTISMKLLHDGTERALTVVLGEAPQQE